MACLAVLLAPPAARAFNPNALWDIVNGKCVPDMSEHDDPKPCAAVDLTMGVDKGAAVLKDIVGNTQFLLIPTARISGIESPDILQAGAPNYWQDAWDARRFVMQRAPAPLARSDIGLAINSQFARTQNQLHIHVDCIQITVRDALAAAQAGIGDDWSSIVLMGQSWRVRRLAQAELDPVNPFKLVRRTLEPDQAAMAGATIVVVGARFAGGQDGFFILAGQAVPGGSGDGGHGEDLLDHACALAARRS